MEHMGLETIIFGCYIHLTEVDTFSTLNKGRYAFLKIFESKRMFWDKEQKHLCFKTGGEHEPGEVQRWSLN